MSQDAVSNLAAKEWTVRIFMSEHDGNTRAEARLDTGSGSGLTGIGLARLTAQDADVPEIGDEVAAARALADLAERLLHTAEADVEAVHPSPR